MIIRIDQTSPDPLYLQIRNQIVAAIAHGQLLPADTLPSVRNLARDLGINFHTVNKAYAVLRDEGYVVMRGRSGAYVADPAASEPLHKEAGHARLDEALLALALECRAQGAPLDDFVARAQAQAEKAYGKEV